MTWQKRIAKEWIWFICTLVGALIIAPVCLVISGDRINFVGVIILTFILMLAVYFIRLTVWAIKQVKRKEGE
jgi:hypothetical protein